MSDVELFEKGIGAVMEKEERVSVWKTPTAGTAEESLQTVLLIPVVDS